jgi:ligand-binding sensor domain-containing protein
LNVNAQEAILISAYNSELPENDLWSISVDQNGNKWIGTSTNGVLKYDGKTFYSYNKQNSPVKGKFISPIFIDSDDNVWINYSNPYGLVKYDGKNWESFSASEVKLSQLSIIDIVESPSGDIFFASTNGIVVYDGSNWKKFDLPQRTKYTVRAIAFSETGEIAVGLNINELLIKKEDTWISYTTDSSELQQYVKSLIYDHEKLIIGYGGSKVGGFSTLDKNGEWKHFNSENTTLSNNSVRDIKKDINGDLWLATNKGINMFNHKILTPYYFGESLNVVMDITVEKNIIWLATRFGLVKIVVQKR